MRHLLSVCSLLVLATALCGCALTRNMAYVTTPDEETGFARDPATGAVVLLPRGAATPWGDPSLAPRVSGAPRTPITFRRGGSFTGGIPASSGISSSPHALEIFGAIMDAISVDDPASGMSALLRGARVADGPRLPSPVPQRPNLSVDLQRQIIYTGRFAVMVPDVEEAVKTTAKAAGEFGGYVQKQTNNTIVIRVPAAKFHEAVQRIEQLGVVRQKSIDAQDVTEKYMDLKLRLGARTAYLDQLKKMLDNAKDKKT